MQLDRLSARHGDDGAPAILTREGRRLLTERAGRLRAFLGEGDPSSRTAADYQRAASELRRLDWLVSHATIAEDLPDDPALVELGEAVTVQDEFGDVERFLLVHPAEASLDHTRISSCSPLARALLGRQVGDEVEVLAPGGAYRCRILAAERIGSAGLGDADDDQAT